MLHFKNKNLKNVLGLAILLSSSWAQTSFGWGRAGHIIVAQVGSQLTGSGAPFWKTNTSNMILLTVVPDLYWKDLPTNAIEKPTHFFQPDAYFSDPSQFGQIPLFYSGAVSQFSQPFVDRNGTSVWRAPQFYALSLQAIRRGDFKTALEMAGMMSHYIGDMSQPLHDARNYDGQETGQPGIHFFFETSNVEAVDHNTMINAVGAAASALLQNPAFVSQFQGSLESIFFREVGRAYAYKDTLLAIDKQEGRSGQGAVDLQRLAVARMADGAATLAIILSRLWNEAGNPQGAVSVSVNVPTWVPPQYASPSFSSFASMSVAPGTFDPELMLADDCAR